MVVGSCLITGGTGYIGSHTALALLEADYEVVIVDNLYNSSDEPVKRIEMLCGKKPALYKVDITDQKGLEEVFSKHPAIDSVIHFAALKVSLGAKEYRPEAYKRRLLASPVRYRSTISVSTLPVPWLF